MALIQNKRARHDYAIEEKFEAGIVLQGWEVKSVRATRAHKNHPHKKLRDRQQIQSIALWLNEMELRTRPART